MANGRFRWGLVEVVFLVCAWCVPVGACRAEGNAIAVTSSLVKVPRRGRFATLDGVMLEAARGEAEAAQVVVTGPATVTARMRPLIGPHGVRLAQRLYRVGYVELAQPSNIEGGTGPWPDPLYPWTDGVRVEAGTNQPIWIEIEVPRDAPAGEYRGAVEVALDGQVRAVPIGVRVFPFALPTRPTLPILVGYASRSIARGHGLNEPDPQLTQRYAESLLRHRLNPIGGTFEPPPHQWDGKKVTVDWSAYDAELAPLFARGLTMADLRLPGNVTGAERAALLAEWRRHFRERGWQLFDYTMDEPRPDQYPALRDRAAAVGAAGIPRLVTHGPDPALAGAVDIWTPVVNQVRAPAPAGMRMFWYQSCESHGCDIVGGREYTGWPSLMIDVRTAVANRILEWLAYRYRVAGELYYNSVEGYNIGSIRTHGGNGDGTLFYAGKSEPIESIRLKILRDAEEDYEYLRLAGPTVAMRELDRIARAPRDWNRDPGALLAARHRLAVAISNGVTKGNATARQTATIP